MHSLELLASGLGLAAGGMAGWLWMFISARFGNDGFWQRLNDVGRSLLSTNSKDQFFHQYLRLLPTLMKYVVKQLSTLVLAFVPVIVVFEILTPYATRSWDERVTHVEVTPPQKLVVKVTGKTINLDETRNKIPNGIFLNTSATLSTTAGEFHCASLMRKQAYCPDRMQRLVLSILGFETLHPETSAPTDGTPSILLRPSSGDDNFLWPYVNDWEFDFLVAVSLASVVSMFVLKAKKR